MELIACGISPSFQDEAMQGHRDAVSRMAKKMLNFRDGKSHVFRIKLKATENVKHKCNVPDFHGNPSSFSFLVDCFFKHQM